MFNWFKKKEKIDYSKYGVRIVVDFPFITASISVEDLKGDSHNLK